MSKTILVTGGSRGIGRAVAILAGKRGWRVAITYVANDAAAQETIAAVEAAGGKSLAIKADAAKLDDVALAFDATEKAFGAVDGFVNNAGIATQVSKLADKDPQEIARLVEINVLGALYGAREAARRMSKSRGGKGGVIVNMSSAAARLGMPGEGVDYAASKGSMDTLTYGLSKELAPEGVRVNAVRPGMIATDIHAAMGAPDRAERLGKTVPIGREGTADEVAEGVVWLLSDEASYVAGAVLDITGGR
ncbi:MAG: SDR family oxidoreductase [Hyphomicrobiales bacterium]|nr:SDR family oxidoreductase [Rhodoblastus sp.]MCB9997706.1 SDR family oxidoreductase [Methylobacteriaceae bacterium]MCC2104355.1 SDR family oxidoreductase [Hyphomicrobiales bacterium]HRY05086.1 SDR family oxidoreductase [Beijerinckiaceae bacterium]MCB1524561.1 SDR family oxidoreductase [Rhodoblastus sp.]